MRVHATLNNLRIAPRKVRLVAHSIVGLPVDQALLVLREQVKRATSPMATLLESAIANATNNHTLDKASLRVKEVLVGDGLRLKRYMPKAFGQATPILRRGSNVKIILEGSVATLPEKKTAKKTKSAPKTEASKPEVAPAVSSAVTPAA